MKLEQKIKFVLGWLPPMLAFLLMAWAGEHIGAGLLYPLAAFKGISAASAKPDYIVISQNIRVKKPDYDREIDWGITAPIPKLHTQ